MNYTVNVKLMHCKYVLLQLTRPAQDLLMSLALNCNSHSTEDVEVISNLIRMRLKTKPLANHYVTCIKYVHFLEYLILFSVKPSSGIEVNPKFTHILLLWLNFCYNTWFRNIWRNRKQHFFEGKVYYHVVTFTLWGIK